MHYLIKKAVKTSLTFILSGLAFSCLAEKIVTIDLQELYSTSPQGITAKKKLDLKLQANKDGFEKKQAEFSQKAQKYNRDKDILSAEEKKKQEKQLQDLAQELERTGQNLELEMNESQSQEIESLSKLIRSVTADIAKEEQLDLVLPIQVPIYVKGATDITPKVLVALKKLNDKK